MATEASRMLPACLCWQTQRASGESAYLKHSKVPLDPLARSARLRLSFANAVTVLSARTDRASPRTWQTGLPGR